jgi:hypothetical protein
MVWQKERAVLRAVVLGSGVFFVKPVLAAYDACGPVQAMVHNLNTVPRVHATERVVNDGAGWSGMRERIAIDTKQYDRSEDGAWSLAIRHRSEPETVINCEFIRHESLDGVTTAVYRYERLGGPQTDRRDPHINRFEVWISKETGLPVKSHFKAFSGTGGERYFTFTFGPNIKEPFKPKKAWPPIQ